MKFAPPPRVPTKAEKTKKAQEERLRLKKERERRYQEAVDEIAAMAAEEAEDGFNVVPPMPIALKARVRVSGAGEKRLNGKYHVEYATKERVEFHKEEQDSRGCQLTWSGQHGEWRLLIGDYKLGSTLYRHTHRPNVQVDEHLGVPKDGWQQWFGKSPCPTIEYLEEDQGEEEEDVDEEEDCTGEEVGRESAGRPTKAVQAERSPLSPTSKKKGEFIELHNPLRIVKDAPAK